LIPWDEFVISEEKYIGTSRNELFLSKFPDIQIILTRSAADKLRQAVEALVHVESKTKVVIA